MPTIHAPTTADEVLVIAAILGDFSAFNLLASRYRKAALRIARNIVGDTEAEDVVQESLLTAFKALPTIDDPDCFGPWLKAITRNKALRFHSKRQNQEKKLTDVDQFLLEQIPSAAPQPYQEDVGLSAAIDALPKDYALALKLHFVDQIPQKHIAAFLDVPLSTVKWRVHQGKKLLREKLSEKESQDEQRSIQRNLKAC